MPDFRVQVLSFRLGVRDRPLPFSNPAANTIRGALGFALHAVSPEVYKRLYEPVAVDRSDLSNPPRPFVLRARELNDRVVLPGETFSLAVHLFADDPGIASAVHQSFQSIADAGFGPARSRCELLSYRTEQQLLSFKITEADVSQIRVCFQSPTELKSNGQLPLQPDFALLFGRVYHRIHTLQSLYAAHAFPDNLAMLTEQASQIGQVTSDIQHISLSRRSSRTGQQHPLGGFVGSAVYTGAMAEFMPYLRIAEWTGVGRQTTWGKGEIKVEIL